MDVERLIQRAQQGDLEAFAEVTRRFQHMAFGYAVALLRDLQQAEDVVQEAFVAAWFYFTGGMDEIRAKVEVEGSKP